MRSAVCVIVKNEAEILREWIAYQRVIGFGSVILYDNASSDATRDVALSMSNVLDVRVHDLPESPDPGSQMRCYEKCLRDYAGEFDWIAFIDADEFLVSNDGRRIHSLLSHNRHASAIALNWLCFGGNGHIERPPGLTIAAFTRRSETDFGPNSNTKMIVRPRAARRVINSHYIEVDGPTVSPTGSSVTWREPGFTAGVEVSWWRLNHYFTRSRAQWTTKVARGYKGYGSLTTRRIHDFELYDRNEILDEKAVAHADEVLEIIAASLAEKTWRPSEGSGGELAAPVKIVRAANRFWTDDLLLGANNRMKHAGHGSSGEYLLAGEFLLVKWDDWPAELFLKRDGVYMVAPDPI